MFMSDDMNFEIKNEVNNAKAFYEDLFDESVSWDELSEATQDRFEEFYGYSITVELDWREMFIKNGVRFEMNCPKYLRKKGKEELFNLILRGSDWEDMLNDEIWHKVMNMDGKVRTEFGGESFMSYVFDCRDFDNVEDFLGECEYMLDDMPEHYIINHTVFSGGFAQEQTEFCHMMDNIKDNILWNIDEEELEDFLVNAGIVSVYDDDKGEWSVNTISVLLGERYFGLEKDNGIVLDFYKDVRDSSALADKWQLQNFIEVSYY